MGLNLNPFQWGKKKVHQHQVIITYHSGANRKKYDGEDEGEAKKKFDEYKVKCRSNPLGNILSGTWYRDGDSYQSF